MHFRSLVVVVLLLAGCGHFEPRVSVESDRTRAQAGRATAAPKAAPKSTHADYVVVRGDTLYGIAFRNKLDFRDVAAWNNINAPHTIYPGQSLRLAPPSRTTRVTTAQRPRPSTPPPRPSTPLQTIVSSTPTPIATPNPTASAQVPVSVTENSEMFAIRDDGAAPTSEVAAVAQPLQPVGEPLPLATGATSAATPVTTTLVAPATPAVVDFTPRAVVEPHAPARERDGVRWRWPVSGRVIGRFVEGDPTQQGIDVSGQLAQPVLAASDGEVVYSGNGLLGYGELVIVQHTPGFLSAYGHNQKRLVAEGTVVKAGQPIAEMGRRGGVDMLHFEIRKSGKPVDPLAYLPVR